MKLSLETLKQLDAPWPWRVVERDHGIFIDSAGGAVVASTGARGDAKAHERASLICRAVNDWAHQAATDDAVEGLREALGGQAEAEESRADERAERAAFDAERLEEVRAALRGPLRVCFCAHSAHPEQFACICGGAG